MENTQRDAHYMGLAYKIAVATPKVARCKIAALVVYKNQIMGVGVNSYKFHPFQVRFQTDPTKMSMHAEVAAVKNALYNMRVDKLPRCTLYVSRAKNVNSNPHRFTSGMARPCPGCQMCISTFELRRVVYSVEGNEFEVL